MPDRDFALLANAESIALSAVPVLAFERFRRAVCDSTGGGERISALFGLPQGDQHLRIFAVLTHDEDGELAVGAADVSGSYEAITPDCPQAHWFERELAELWGVEPHGHPWLKPIRFSPPRGIGDGEKATGDRAGGARAGGGGNATASFDHGQPVGAGSRCGVTGFFQVDGPEIHEVAVGPVHAGVIEPGHFRFQCHGEEVLHLEISLGYQHRGVERALVGGPDRRTIHYLETLAGDTTVGHMHAYCQAVEALAKVGVPPRGMAIRGIALELERIANHVGDLGALAGDIGFLPTASFCGRIRGDFLNLTAGICGSRFGRNLLRPGGVAFDLEDDLPSELLERLEVAARDAGQADELLWNTPSAMARFEGTGVVPADVCQRIGLVGPPARACGFARDVRQDHPFGIYQYAHIPSCTWSSGDVFGRAHIRSIETQRSISFVREQLAALPTGSARVKTALALAPDRLAVSLVEGWRGEICHVAVTGSDGRFVSYKVVDPSFHNWFGLAYAMRGQPISDFPLCNKSFNLSYCGHDL